MVHRIRATLADCQRRDVPFQSEARLGPPHATWIIDCLEDFGLAERRNDPHDRRVKLVVLTAKGVKMRQDLMDEFHTPPAELFVLDRADLQSLQRLLEKLIERSSNSEK